MNKKTNPFLVKKSRHFWNIPFFSRTHHNFSEIIIGPPKRCVCVTFGIRHLNSDRRSFEFWVRTRKIPLKHLRKHVQVPIQKKIGENDLVGFSSRSTFCADFGVCRNDTGDGFFRKVDGATISKASVHSRWWKMKVLMFRMSALMKITSWTSISCRPI